MALISHIILLSFAQPCFPRNKFAGNQGIVQLINPEVFDQRGLDDKPSLSLAKEPRKAEKEKSENEEI